MSRSDEAVARSANGNQKNRAGGTAAIVSILNIFFRVAARPGIAFRQAAVVPDAAINGAGLYV